MGMYDSRWFNQTWTLPIETLKSSRKDKKCTNCKVIKDKMTNVIAEILKRTKKEKVQEDMRGTDLFPGGDQRRSCLWVSPEVLVRLY